MGWMTSRHAILAALRRGTGGTLYVTGSGPRNRELVDAARQGGVAVETVDGGWLRRHAGDRARGAALQTQETAGASPTVELAEWLASRAPAADAPGLIVALDHVTDPHNLGAVLRSALLTGASLVVVPTRRSATGGDAVARTSAGASRFMPVAYVNNLRAALEQCREAGWWIYGADAGGEPAPSVSFARHVVLVMGAEGKGLSPLVRKTCDAVVTLPGTTPPESGVDSYNVSVATGMLLYEYRRQYPAD